MVALGEKTAGLFTNSDEFAKEILESSKNVDEPLWHMPITEEHRKTIERDVADVSNEGKSRWADASAGAAFLERFLEKQPDGSETKWAHLDIAGTCIDKKTGCTGFGTQLMIDLI